MQHSRYSTVYSVFSTYDLKLPVQYRQSFSHVAQNDSDKNNRFFLINKCCKRLFSQGLVLRGWIKQIIKCGELEVVRRINQKRQIFEWQINRQFRWQTEVRRRPTLYYVWPIETSYGHSKFLGHCCSFLCQVCWVLIAMRHAATITSVSQSFHQKNYVSA